MEPIKVINYQEEKENFSPKKIYESCIRSGASKEIAREITQEIKNNAYDGITTGEIADSVKRLLAVKTQKSSIRFSLKEAMRKLGPSGFDFEKFIVAVLEENGFEVQINKMVPGLCIPSYEIDFVADKEGVRRIGECKYHSCPGERVDLKVALYNQARFIDITKNPAFKNINLKAMLVTNAKFTSETINYSECNNVELLGWRYPKEGGLEKLIEDHNLYPITILPSFKKDFKTSFADNQIMLAKDLLNTAPKQISQQTGIHIRFINQLVEEANILIN